MDFISLLSRTTSNLPLSKVKGTNSNGLGGIKVITWLLSTIVLGGATCITACSSGLYTENLRSQAAGTSQRTATAKATSEISQRSPQPILPPSKQRGILTGELSVNGFDLPEHEALSAESFVNQIGVVTHFSYTDTAYYTDFSAVLAALQKLGVRHVRDGYYPWPADSPIVQMHRQLASSGITTDYVVPYDISTTPMAIEQFAAEVGDTESLEAPNECDVSNNCGENGIDDVALFLPIVNKAASDLNISTVGPSFALPQSYLTAGNLTSDMTVNNLHVYFGGRNPGSGGWGNADTQGNAYGSLPYWFDMAEEDGPGLASEITETGYIAYPTTTVPYTLPESVEASYIPRSLLLACQEGIKETFVYELLDEVSSPGYGLLRTDLSPKPAFTAIQNLIATLSDSGGTFRPGSLPYTISGGGSDLKQLLFEKSDGSFWLVLWVEASSWDPVNANPISITPENVLIQLSSSYHTVTDYHFDATGNVTLFEQPMSNNSAGLTVTDQISIVKIQQD